MYKRVDATTIVPLTIEPLGTTEFVDSAGLVGDEYYATFSSSTLGVESLPSNIYRVGTPWMQGMGVILALDTVSSHPSVDTVAVYRRRFAASDALRIGAVPLGTQFFSDPAGQPGDEYHTTFVNELSLAESQPGPSVIADAESGTIVVSGTFKDVRNAGTGQGPGVRDPVGPGPHVEVVLRWPKRYQSPNANGQTIGRTYYDVTVQAAGVWSVPLIPNDMILGLQSYYEFTFTDGEKYFKRVSSVNGLAQNFALLEEVLPLELR